VMMHGDDDGIVLPPRLAPLHAVILPIFRNDEERGGVMEYCKRVERELAATSYDGQPVRVSIDARDLRGGDKVWQHIKRGVPLRLEIGPRDVAGDSVFVGRRDTSQKQGVQRAELVATIADRLADIQQNLFSRALEFRKQNTRVIDDREEFIRFFTPKNEEKPEIHGGFAISHFCENAEVAELLAKLKVTIRCLPISGEQLDGAAAEQSGRCIFTGQPSPCRAVFAKAY
jgi:prolyl-tRNA synthetase